MKCPECGAPLENNMTCREYLNRMLAWDFEDFKGVGKVHHLTVLCYYLQHPHTYSKQALPEAVQMLKDIVKNAIDVSELYRKESDIFSSEKRDWNVEGTADNHGEYSSTIKWSITAADVVKDGIAQYPEYVRKWADAIYSDLLKSGDLS